MNRYKRVVLIGVDGAGAFFQKARTPNIDRIFEKGAVSYHVLSADPTISAECWGSMLIGVTPKIHRITNHRAERIPRDVQSEFPSVFRVIRERDPEAELASFCKWSAINHGIIEENLGIHKINAKDEEIPGQVREYLAEHDPKFLFVAFDDVDAAGHKYQFGSPEYYLQIQITDGYIGQIYDAYKELGLLEDTLFLVTADHGGREFYHGGQSNEEKYIMFAASGGYVSEGTIGDMEIRDVAAIVLYALGMEQPRSWTARVPSGLFEGVEAADRPVYEGKIYEKPYRTHKPHSGIAMSSGKNVTDLIGKERLLAYLPFDGSILDVTGRMSPQRLGKLYFVEGYLGQGTQFQDGGILLGKHNLGKKSFSTAFWMKTNGMSYLANLFSNKDHPNDKIPGYELAIGVGTVLFRYGDGKDNENLFELYPEDFRDGWVYVVLVVDREAGEIRFSYDFDEFHITAIPDQWRDLPMDGNGRLYIGTGSPDSHGDSLYAVLDEYLIIDGVLNQEDVRRLAEYYGA